MPITFEFIDNGKSFNINFSGIQYTAGKSDVELVIPDIADNNTLEIRSNSAKFTDVTVYLDTDIIIGVGAGSTTATELRDALQAIFFLDEFASKEYVDDNFLNKVTTSPQTVAGSVEFLEDITVPSNSVILGRDGARISSGARTLSFTDAREKQDTLVHYQFDENGSQRAYQWEGGLPVDFPVVDALGTILSGNQDYYFTPALGDARVVAFNVIPKSAGTLRVQSWEGSDDTGAVLVDNSFEITLPMVATFNSLNPFRIEIPSPLIGETGDDQYTRFSGVDLEGGTQVGGAFDGQTLPFLFSEVQLLTKKNLAYEDEITDLETNKADRDGDSLTNTTINGVTLSNVNFSGWYLNGLGNYVQPLSNEVINNSDINGLYVTQALNNLRRYYQFSKSGLTRPSQTTIPLANQQSNVYETYHEYIYTPNVTDNYNISAFGSWSMNVTNANIRIRLSLVGGSINEEIDLIIEPKDSGGTGEVVNVLQGGNIVGNVNTSTDIRTPYYIQTTETLEQGEIYTLKVEFSADSANQEATIYSNLFQVEQKTVK